MKHSPEVEHISWGRIRIRGFSELFKDVKLFPGTAREWDWNETGTRHNPGVQPADVREIVEGGAERVILSTGMERRLRVKAETLEWLTDRGIKVDVLPTQEAVELYNSLLPDEMVGALIHSTC